MSSKIQYGSIYKDSWFGSLSTNYWGYDYEIEYLKSDLKRRVQIFEDNTITVQLLENLK